VSWQELSWTVPALIAVVFVTWNFIISLKQYKTARKLRKVTGLNGGRSAITGYNMITDTSLLIISLAFVCVGLYFMCMPPNPATTSYRDQIILSGVLIFSSLVLTGLAITRRYIRQRIFDYVRRGDVRDNKKLRDKVAFLNELDELVKLPLKQRQAKLNDMISIERDKHGKNS
jgi:hypothetical protein